MSVRSISELEAKLPHELQTPDEEIGGRVMYRLLAIQAAWIVLLSVPAFAASYTVVVQNPGEERVIGISVLHAKVVGFEPTSAKEFILTVELPENGTCNPIVRVRFRGGSYAEGRAMICQGGGFTIR